MQRRNASTPARRWIRRVAATTAAAGIVAGTSLIAAGPASAATYCGATPDGGFGCIIDQGDGSFKMANSDGDIIYNW
ncbi:hypothetical protein MXD62_10990 [Frankia sp. Mgl5]|uniref:hypothetical protein n=1 Tax=Frankia sp. Mgl5 TaxID=2933793 RepID=UPI00200DDD97|nr:hypothetical protein [Frankia sp. Mgl5]MCK9927689.1 hypothetical protein [Frankia sp. Mgl5]